VEIGNPSNAIPAGLSQPENSTESFGRNKRIFFEFYTKIICTASEA
jgi:hypothetical protein